MGDVDLAGPQVAEARLLDQLAPLVGVGHPEGQAAAAALRAGAPRAGLGDAVLVPAPGLSWNSWTHTGGGGEGVNTCSATPSVPLCEQICCSSHV